MTRSHAYPLALLLATSLVSPGHAAQDPQPGRFDPRVRTVAYNPMNLVRLVGSTFTSTQVILAAGETITHVAIGDSEAWLPQPAGHLLFIKPIEVRAPTNMQVVTTRPDGTARSYQFELVARAAPAVAAGASSPAGTGAGVTGGTGTAATPSAGTGTGAAAGSGLRSASGTSNGVGAGTGTGAAPGTGTGMGTNADRNAPSLLAATTPFAIQFVYPQDERDAALARRGREAAASARQQAESRLAADYLYGPRNWRYAAQGSAAIEPPRSATMAA